MFPKVWNRDLNLSDFGENINLPESSQKRKCLSGIGIFYLLAKYPFINMC